MTKQYKDVSPKMNFPEMETDILNFWADDKTFEKSLDARKTGKRFSFWDGPPTANGMPHYGHISISAIKDAVCRYKTMNGFYVPRNFGWDCHGLPVEIEVCKSRGLPDKDAILKYGLEKFNEDCKTDVMKYSSAWVKTINRIGRWGDFEHDYKTMDFSFMESVMWAISELYKKGLLYEGYKVMAYSYGAETPLSNSEAKMEYQDKTDPAITVMFKLKEQIDGKNTYALVWTTTPWTLITNMALVVGEDIEYSIMEENGKNYILASALVEKYKKQLENAKLVREIKGKDLIGKSYEPIFDYFPDIENAYQIYSADFVTTTDGTGIVHMAPYGEDDFNILKQHKIKIVNPVNTKGCFSEEIPEYAGKLVFDASEDVITNLKSRGVLVKKENYVHSYPFCWRTKTPLIYRPMESWFVAVEKIKDLLLSENQKINWVPEHFKNGRFGNWLENAMDWGISRNRFWGCPLPIWVSDNPKYPRTDVFGSFAEIEAASGQKITNPHRPFIDEIKYKNPDDTTGQSMMVRIPDVLDCWFESGSMPFASLHYPFENKAEFEKSFPADFIAEGQDQTRGWFYTLTILAGALFGSRAFKTCVVNGMILNAEKKKLSKSAKNYVAPEIMFDKLGADAFRWYVLSSPLFKAESVCLDESFISKSMRDAIIPLWNAYSFFVLYANADEIKANESFDSENILDKYILAKLKATISKVSSEIDEYSFDRATAEISDFLEILNNWYIRRSRDRFWGTDVSESEEQSAFNTLYTVLLNLVKIIAPISPFITEYIYKNLTNEESVHLTNWPKTPVLTNEEETLIKKMDEVQMITKTAKAIREQFSIRNRLPLSSMTIAGYTDSDFNSILADELNVKQVITTDSYSDYAEDFLYLITPKIGQRLGGALSKIIPASKKGEYKFVGDKLEIAGEVLNPDEFEKRLNIKAGISGMALPDNTAVVILDTNITPELSREGMARDTIRFIQDTRKEMGLNVSDRVKITYNADSDLSLAISEHKNMIMENVLALELESGNANDYSIEIENHKLSIKIQKA